MHDIINLDVFPLDRPASSEWDALLRRCRAQLSETGMFNLPGFLMPAALKDTVEVCEDLLDRRSFHHSRDHNIYFTPTVEGLDPDHPALTKRTTSNRTLCADQLENSALARLYEWAPIAAFLAAAVGKATLFPMSDPLARLNVMGYRAGEALNWHFDRSEFTTTLLLQAPNAGGTFEYARDLRSAEHPNYDGVAALLEGRAHPQRLRLEPGTLNVFMGKNTAHRVTPVKGGLDRIVAVFSFFDRPDVTMSAQDQLGFYGRRA